MTLKTLAIRAFEAVDIPDALTTSAVDYLVAQQSRKLRSLDKAAHSTFLDEMTRRAIAEHADAANAQHYEVPAQFFALTLGPRRKYSCCLYLNPGDSLAIAEEQALAETALHADLADGQHILELGCGWGSLSLWMAERYPRARITSVSNSQSQRAYIEAEAASRGLANLTVITEDMNRFAPQGSFDRIVSVEMFEHMSNWRSLLGRLRNVIAPEGRLFLHVFSHRQTPYSFDHANPDDWIAQHFFTGGIMPSHGLIRCFDDLFTVEQEWVWSGAHYRRTAQDWLGNFDRNAAPIAAVLRETYGDDWRQWRRRWRLFFLATAGLFGANGGDEWRISHYRLSATR